MQVFFCDATGTHARRTIFQGRMKSSVTGVSRELLRVLVEFYKGPF